MEYNHILMNAYLKARPRRWSGSSAHPADIGRLLEMIGSDEAKKTREAHQERISEDYLKKIIRY